MNNERMTMTTSLQSSPDQIKTDALAKYQDSRRVFHAAMIKRDAFERPMSPEALEARKEAKSAAQAMEAAEMECYRVGAMLKPYWR